MEDAEFDRAKGLTIPTALDCSPQFAAAELILNSTTKPLRRRPDRTQLLLLLMAGDIHPNPGPTAKYPCPVVVVCLPRPMEGMG